MTNYEQEQALSKINQSITKSKSKSSAKTNNPDLNPMPVQMLAHQNTAQTTPPTYPFPAYAIVKER
jgi:hypothetical protein